MKIIFAEMQRLGITDIKDNDDYENYKTKFEELEYLEQQKGFVKYHKNVSSTPKMERDHKL